MSAEFVYDEASKKFTARQASRFPRAAYKFADELEILDIAGDLAALPDDMERFSRLRVVFLSNSKFSEVPPQLAACPKLEMLGMRSCQITTWADDALPVGIRGITLTDNRLQTIPASIGKLAHLQKLMVSGNRLTDLPRDLLRCTRLDNLRVAANNLSAEPAWLSGLPSLAWYSDSGNAFSAAGAQDTLPAVAWRDITLGEQIGASAKNSVYSARLQDGRAVAVKLYGGHLSTDGLVADEIRASIAAGSHAHLISAVATVVDTPDGKPAIVLPLVTADFKQLGSPPNLVTLTRDVFAADRLFETSFIRQVAADVADAGAYLHARGVQHGDLYAHNILTNSGGSSYLGDFGGSAVYDRPQGRWRESLDVLAFGNLLDDLLTRSHDPGDKNLMALQALRQDCIQPTAAKRPVFTDIARRLTV